MLLINDIAQNFNANTFLVHFFLESKGLYWKYSSDANKLIRLPKKKIDYRKWPLYFYAMDTPSLQEMLFFASK
jgi:hypothetical protein